MLSILTTTELQTTVSQYIASEYRLDELVTLCTDKSSFANAQLNIIADHEGIRAGLDWSNQTPPYLLPRPVAFTKDNLLGTVFGLLGNFEKCWQYLERQPELLAEWEMFARLQQNYPFDSYRLPKTEASTPFEAYRQLHNAAVIRQYGDAGQPAPWTAISGFYQKAIDAAPDDEHRAFSVRHWVTFLLDTRNFDEAGVWIERTLQQVISQEAEFALKTLQVQLWMEKLTVPYDESLVARLKHTLWETLEFYEKHNRKADAGLLLIDASFIANISNSFSESLGYITKAIRWFEEENLTELVGNALIRKGTLLYTWSHNGNPQFYRPALEAYQEALKIFTKEAAPDVFADIHHNLGVLYSEMPDENKKRSIWAAMSSGSFKETLSYYTKEQFPYEYAMICTNYGNAITRFPQMKLTDNYERALELYREALSIRTAEHFPYERALTLLNYLEACWLVGDPTEEFNYNRYEDMLAKAQEIKTLVTDAHLLEEADKQLQLLARLREVARDDSRITAG